MRRNRGGEESCGLWTVGTASPQMPSYRGSSKTGKKKNTKIQPKRKHAAADHLHGNACVLSAVWLQTAVWGEEPEKGGQRDRRDPGHEAPGGGQDSRASPGCALETAPEAQLIQTHSLLKSPFQHMLILAAWFIAAVGTIRYIVCSSARACSSCSYILHMHLCSCQ